MNTNEAVTYIIPAHLMDKAKSIISRANNRLSRAGIEDKFVYQCEDTVTMIDGVRYAAVRMTVNVPAISYDGWEFIAAVDILESGTVLRSARDIDLDDVIRPVDHRCDHCGMARSRKYSYLLRHEVTGEIKQVGNSCLQLFLGVEPAGLWLLQWDDLEVFTDKSSFSSDAQLSSVNDIIRVALVLTDNGRKYVSRDRSRENDSLATADAVSQVLFPGTIISSVNDAQKVMSVADTIDDCLVHEVKMSAQGVSGSYGDNLRTVMGEVYVTPRYIGLVCSAVSVYHRSQEIMVKKRLEEETKASLVKGYIAEKKEKIEGIPATVTKMVDYDSYYGSQTMVLLTTDDGYVMKWRSGSVPEKVGDQDFKVGSRVILTRATVKDHSVYDGVYQTDIIRPKFSMS